MAVFTNFKGSCLVSSKVLVGPGLFPGCLATPGAPLAAGWARSRASGNERLGLVDPGHHLHLACPWITSLFAGLVEVALKDRCELELPRAPLCR